MAKGVFMFLSFFFLYFFTDCSSGTLVGFSYNAKRNGVISSPIETISFLKKNNVSLSQIRAFVEDHRVLNALSNTGVVVDLYLNETEAKNLRISKASAISWLKTHLIAFLPHINITNIVVSSSGSNSLAHKQLHILLSTLNSIHSALKSFDLDHEVKVSVAFSLTILQDLGRKHASDLKQIVDFVENCGSFIMVETKINGQLSMGDQFVGLMIKSATTAATLLHYSDVPMVLNVKNSAVPSALEVALFTNKTMKYLQGHTHIIDRIAGLFAEISPMEESEKRELNREEEQMFHSSHRELNSATKITRHDTINPPTPTVITVPSTTPVTVTPTNPATTPVTVPATTPVITTPSNVPPSNSVNPPTTAPPSNPITTPIIVLAPPVIPNPGTNPVPPPSGNPITTPPTTSSPPIGSGQTWCMAKTGAMESTLQVALDYACGIGGVDCSTIQPTGSCYNPNTLQNHASYAFNIYYQKNPVPSSCDFKGVAVIVNTNPSTGACVYPSSSSSPSVSTSSSPPSALNTSYPALSAPTIFGSGPPPAISTAESIAAGLQPLFAFIITGKLILGM